MRHGFKTYARQLALEVRAELGVKQTEALDPHRLAHHLEIPVIALSSVGGCEEATAHFRDVEPETFSAVTVFHGPHRTVVHNDAHAPGRQHSNISHEIAHGLLGHAPTPALDDTGCRLWDQEVEDEASYLGAVTLVPDAVAMLVVRKGYSVADAAGHYGVSEQLMTWMINDCGARIRVSRERARRRS